MIKKIFTLSMFLCATLFAFAASKAEGDALYEKEQYEEAAKVYETLLHDNGMSAEVYYNLGNCYYKMDLIPQAILNYERAYLLNPGDGDIRANLALARGKTIDKVVPPSETNPLPRTRYRPADSRILLPRHPVLYHQRRPRTCCPLLRPPSGRRGTLHVLVSPPCQEDRHTRSHGPLGRRHRGELCRCHTVW